eukprot:TRINITY_DN17145_c0_g1_i2.p1 TRINITY_DN17145_c0_g1~~TRINITY_DN17145_c0_g1_i2.p1  ORF type:complete len:222 (-),score=20.81 TRINITY_DN17145_c0_g1_i2:115-780(-)
MDQTAPRQVRSPKKSRPASRAQAIEQARKSWQYSTTHDGAVNPRFKEIVQEGDDRQSRLYNFELHPLDCLLDHGEWAPEDLAYFNHYWDRHTFTRTLQARTIRIYSKAQLVKCMAEIRMAPIKITDSKSKVDGFFMGRIAKRTTVGVLSSLSVPELCNFHGATTREQLLPKVMVMARVTIDDSVPRQVQASVTLRTALRNVRPLQDNFVDYVKSTLDGMTW